MLDFNQFKKQLSFLISFPSVKGEYSPSSPFGKGINDALVFTLDLAKSFGFEVINYDGYGGEISIGEGEEIGIITHVDVVPASNGWDYPPFFLTEKDGILYGRGVEDDKAPTLLILFALKSLKDEGVKFNRKIRFFIGCDEENDWKDVEYIKTKTTLPEFGFSPDGNFPVTYAEKGVYKLSIKLFSPKDFEFLPSGKALNAVCDYAELKLKGKINKKDIENLNLSLKEDKVISEGVSAHGSAPWEGKNAIKPLLELLLRLGEKEATPLLELFNEKSFDFKSEQGKLTLSPNMIVEKNGNFYLDVDVRVPAPLSICVIEEKLKELNLEYQITEKLPPVMTEKDGFFINSLLSAYKEITKNHDAKAEAMGGSTFGRAFKKGCSFGICEKGMSGNIHGDNEWIKEDWLKKCFEIYHLALYNIVK